MSSQAWRIYEQQRIRHEKRHAPKIYRAIRKQFIEFADRIEKGEDIHSFLPIEELALTIRNLYIETGGAFARWQTRELDAGIKRFNVNDQWVSEIIEYFRMHLFDKTVLPITGTTRDIVLKIMERAQQEGWGVDKIVSYIRKETVELSRTRTRLIVRTETGRAANLGKWKAAQSFQFETNKIWVSAGDRRVRPQPSFSPDAANHIVLNGKPAGLDDAFPNGLAFPGDPNGSAKETCNCRCTMIFKTVKDADGNPIRRRFTTTLNNAAMFT